jgi:ubiquinone/menaquinone biosynthesis C-methylase UbiE
MKRNICDGIDVDGIRSSFLVYTRKAFRLLPYINNLKILDIGCGSGVPTLELARLSGGYVTGMDIDISQLEKLKKKASKEGLDGRIKVMECSILEMNFEDESFDIIWAEGSISVVGFEKGIREWRRLIKKDGYLVVHDTLLGLEGKLKTIRKAGYELIDYFTMGLDVWMDEYLHPLKESIAEYDRCCESDDEKSEEISSYRREIEEFEKHPELNESVFFIMKKLGE